MTMANRKQSSRKVVKICPNCGIINIIEKSERAAGTMKCGECGDLLPVSRNSVATFMMRVFNTDRYDRRAFMNLAFKGSVTVAALAAAGLTIWQFADERLGPSLEERLYRRLETLVRLPTLREIEFRFAETFHLDAPLVSLSLGRDNYPLGYHVDNLAAGLSIAGPLGLLEKDRRPTRTEGSIDAPINSDMILIGGPNSTPLTQIAWEFKGPNDYQQVRANEPVIPLTYYGISDTEGLERVGWSMEGQGDVPAFNWPFVCTDPQRSYSELVPEYSSETLLTERDGRTETVPLLRTNYLLVTRLPNFLAPNFPEIVMKSPREDWPYLLVFEGNHGIGTRGVELLLTADGSRLLDKLQDSLKGVSAFQQMFRLGEIGRTPAEFHKFNSIELFGDVAPIEVQDATYLRAHEQGMERMRQAKETA